MFFSNLSLFGIGKTLFIARILCLSILKKSFVLEVAPTLPLRQWDLWLLIKEDRSKVTKQCVLTFCCVHASIVKHKRFHNYIFIRKPSSVNAVWPPLCIHFLLFIKKKTFLWWKFTHAHCNIKTFVLVLCICTCLP